MTHKYLCFFFSFLAFTVAAPCSQTRAQTTAAGETPNEIVVSSDASVWLAPDTVRATILIEGEGASAEEAWQKLNKKTDAVRAALKKSRFTDLRMTPRGKKLTGAAGAPRPKAVGRHRKIVRRCDSIQCLRCLSDGFQPATKRPAGVIFDQLSVL